MRVFHPAWFLAVLTVASPLAAQSVDPFPSPPQGLAESERPPAYVATLDGEATLTRAGESLTLDLNAPVIDGDRLRVGAGFVELRWPDGRSLFLDSRTSLDMVTVDRLRLSDGQVRLVAGRPSPASWVIDTPSAEVRLDRAVDTFLMVDARSAAQAVEVFSLAGDVDVVNDQGRATASQGESIHAEAFRAPAAGRGRVPAGGFVAWSDARIAEQRAFASQAPVTREGVVEYGDSDYAEDPTLVRYGTWDRDPEYGAVWYPTAPETWQPYYYGRWESAGRYGNVWVGTDPWSYRTHHYGRWGHRGGRWFWIPGRTWASAWVSWAVGPGYVSWSPLGYDNRPVFSFNLSIGSTYNRGYRNGYDGWSGWTVVPTDRWRVRGRVDRYAVNPRQLPAQVRGAFVTQSMAPNRGNLSRMGREGYGLSRAGGGDARDTFRGTGPTRIDRGAPVAPPLQRGAERAATSPYERARRATDPRNVPQGSQVPRGESPSGAVRRPSGDDVGSGRPAYAPRIPPSGVDNSRSNPGVYGRRERPASPADAGRPAAPTYTPRSEPRAYEPRPQAPRVESRPYDIRERAPRSEPRAYDSGDRPQRGDAARSREYSRPAPPAPRGDSAGGAVSRPRDSSPPSGGRLASPGGGERSRSNRVPPPRPPREP